MKKRDLLVRGIKAILISFFTLILFFILPILLRYALEITVTFFGIQILQYLLLLGSLIVFLYPLSISIRVRHFPTSNSFYERIIRDWKTFVTLLIICLWGFFVLGFSITAYWLREYNLWVSVILFLSLFYSLLRLGYSRYNSGGVNGVSRGFRISLVSAIVLFVIVLFPYIQVNSVQPLVSSKDLMEFNANSDLIPLHSHFSLEYYLNDFPFNPTEIRIEKNIAYNNYSNLDVYYSDKLETKNPVIIIIHGGGWISGSKNDIPIRTVSKFFAHHGFTVFAINYRLFPEVEFLGMLHDIRDAIVFARNNALNFHGDENRIFLFGRSSGAQLALVAAYGTNVSYFREHSGNYSASEVRVNGVASIYGISEMSTMGSRILGVKNDPESFLFDLASPIKYVNRSGLVPTFISAGTIDTLVPVSNSRNLQRALSTHNNEYMYLEILWANHSFDGFLNGLSGQLMLYYFLIFFSHFTN